ncbi:MAG: DUF362 domain-containing protein [Butyrivibrio sp.]|nr:DUF362 domain-containing protein [Butyrivibrio sp.]
MGRFEKVSLVKCDSYKYEEVRKALDESLSLIDGLGFVKPGMKVGIKTNLISGMNPDRAVTTHPVLLRRLCELLMEKGAEVVIGDSPGGLYTASFVQGVYRASGLSEMVRELSEEVTWTGSGEGSSKGKKGSVKLNDNFKVSDGKFPEAVSLKSFVYTQWLDEVDAIINFSKLKTHAMMGMSCAVKNMFGCIPGTTKPDYHMRFPEEKAFANVMVDLNEFFKPVLYVVDAIDGMEGNGPTAGEKRHIGAILASTKPYALDMVCADMIGMGLADVQTLVAANERGLGPERVSEVDVVGNLELSAGRIPDFKRATIHQSITFEGGGLFNTIKSRAVKIAYSTRPQVKPNECIGCKKCFETCPAKAITMSPRGNGKKTSGKNKNKRHAALIPSIDRSKCIKCFCCQEFCPVGAMKVHYNPLGRLLNKLQR